MKKASAGSNRRPRTVEDVMTLRFRAVFDSLDRLNEQWQRSIRDLQRAQADDLRVTRLVLREHNQRIKALERRPK
jgi:hypothetical protein